MDFNKTEYFNNREWSWLEFNRRVLAEAAEAENPLLERLKFTAIVTSNLEEFFMVRVAALRQQREASFQGSSADMRTPEEQLEGIRVRVKSLLKDQYQIFHGELLPQLEENGIRLLTGLEQLEPFGELLRTIFRNEIRPVLTPISVGPTHPFPNLVSGRLYLAVQLEPEASLDERIEKTDLSFIEIPVKMAGRFVRVDEEVFVPLELVIKLMVPDIYTGYRVIEAGIVRLTRDADFSIEEDAAGDLLKEIETYIKRMHRRSVVKLEYEEGLSRKVVERLMAEGELDQESVYPIPGLLNLQDLFEVYGGLNRPRLKDQPTPPIYPPDFNGQDPFASIDEKDRLLFHPYHAYDPVVEMVTRAAQDSRVLAIKQTLYRTSTDSSIIKALVEAAEAGKYVSVVVELKARFDEERNITWAKTLEDAGVHVIYGLAGLKTHAKALMIVRKEPSGIHRYVHLATGNYNETTARLYTDFSYFTSDESFGEDVTQLYNLMTGFSYPGRWNRLTIAPLDLRSKFADLIRRERENARKGLKGRITAMMNSLSDRGIVEELYLAAMAGVKIRLIVRGICILKPNMKNISDNISVISIVGKYLQHPRIYYFYNGGEEEYYLSSADWMTRNLDRRVEILFPVQDADSRRFLAAMLKIQLNDTINAWALNVNGSYRRLRSKKSNDCFEQIYTYIKKQEAAKVKDDEVQVFRPVTSPQNE